MKRRSKFWLYFKKEDGDAVCTICNKRIKTCGNTSNLASHMKGKHPEECDIEDKSLGKLQRSTAMLTKLMEFLIKDKSDLGYTYEDHITCSKECLPNYEERSFFKEHLHTDEEIHFVLDGSVYFDVRYGKDDWIRIEVVAGDMNITKWNLSPLYC